MEYCKWHGTNKFDNLDEMEKFLERQQLPKLIQDEKKTMNISIARK